MTVTRSTNSREILDAMMTTDEDFLLLHKGEGSGWVRFVYGNSGWDVICDYTMDLETVMAGASALADTLSEREG